MASILVEASTLDPRRGLLLVGAAPVEVGPLALRCRAPPPGPWGPSPRRRRGIRDTRYRGAQCPAFATARGPRRPPGPPRAPRATRGLRAGPPSGWPPIARQPQVVLEAARVLETHCSTFTSISMDCPPHVGRSARTEGRQRSPRSRSRRCPPARRTGAGGRDPAEQQ
eukprot:9493264-Pyramimonas_sp.AAC.1